MLRKKYQIHKPHRFSELKPGDKIFYKHALAFCVPIEKTITIRKVTVKDNKISFTGDDGYHFTLDYNVACMETNIYSENYWDEDLFIKII